MRWEGSNLSAHLSVRQTIMMSGESRNLHFAYAAGSGSGGDENAGAAPAAAALPASAAAANYVVGATAAHSPPYPHPATSDAYSVSSNIETAPHAAALLGAGGSVDLVAPGSAGSSLDIDAPHHHQPLATLFADRYVGGSNAAEQGGIEGSVDGGSISGAGVKAWDVPAPVSGVDGEQHCEAVGEHALDARSALLKELGEQLFAVDNPPQSRQVMAVVCAALQYMQLLMLPIKIVRCQQTIHWRCSCGCRTPVPEGASYLPEGISLDDLLHAAEELQRQLPESGAMVAAAGAASLAAEVPSSIAADNRPLELAALMAVHVGQLKSEQEVAQLLRLERQLRLQESQKNAPPPPPPLPPLPFGGQQQQQQPARTRTQKPQEPQQLPAKKRGAPPPAPPLPPPPFGSVPPAKKAAETSIAAAAAKKRKKCFTALCVSDITIKV